MRTYIIGMSQNFVKKSEYTGEVYNIQLRNLRHRSMKITEIMQEVEGKTHHER